MFAITSLHTLASNVIFLAVTKLAINELQESALGVSFYFFFTEIYAKNCFHGVTTNETRFAASIISGTTGVSLLVCAQKMQDFFGNFPFKTT